MSTPALQKLHEARRWLRWGTALRAGLWSLGAGTLLLALAGLGGVPIRGAFPALILAACVIAAGTALWRWKDLSLVASRLDLATHTKDRFVSWLALEGASGMGSLAREEIDRFASSLGIPRSLKPRFPWPPLAVLSLGLLIIATGWTLRLQREKTLAPERAESIALLEEARQTVKRSSLEPKKAEEIEKLLQEALRQAATSPDPKREALRALGKAEKSLAGSTPFSQEEIAALAAAATPLDPSLAEALSQGPNQETADKLDALDEETLRQITQNAANHRQSQRLQQLARQSQTTMREQIVSAFTPSDPGQQSLSDALQNTRIASAQNRTKPEEPGAGTGQKDGDEPASGSPQDHAPPGGGPGSENDQGKGRDLAEEQAGEPEAERSESLTADAKAQGPSAVRTGLTGGDDQARSSVRSSGNLDAAEAAALDAVSRENIPIGSRILVRRYFEDLRSRE